MPPTIASEPGEGKTYTQNRRLGVILAGGAARRFGSDKAMVVADGRALIDHVALILAGQCDGVAVAGRRHGALAALLDRPSGGAGPLAGLNAALHYAAEHGFTEVLSAPCDALGLPGDLADQLGCGPAYVAQQPVIGRWPVEMAAALDAYLGLGRRAVHGFAADIGARAVALDVAVANINRPEDLTSFLADRAKRSGE